MRRCKIFSTPCILANSEFLEGHMNEDLFLTWVRSTGLDIAIGIFVLGTLWRLFEIYSLGRKPDLAVPRHRPGASGLHTMFRRSVPPPGMFKRSPVSYVGGYVFHIGLFIVVFLFAQHIKLIESLTGLSWPNLPAQFIDATAVVTLATMVLVLSERVNRPVKRFLSTFGDYAAWALTFLPVLTGYLASKHLVLNYTTMLSLHILSAELLLVFIPFTKLFHVFTLWGSRWYNGDVNSKKGVPV
jgi:nitrate reductase gamma subunit